MYPTYHLERLVGGTWQIVQTVSNPEGYRRMLRTKTDLEDNYPAQKYRVTRESVYAGADREVVVP